MAQQPLNNKVPIVNDTGIPTDYFIRLFQTSGFATDGLAGEVASLQVAVQGKVDRAGDVMTGDLYLPGAVVGALSKQNVGADRTVQIVGQNTQASMSMLRHSNSAPGPAVVFGKTRGTVQGDVTAVISGDEIGSFGFFGANGSNINSSVANIGVYVDGSPAGTIVPGRITFFTTTAGGSLTQKFVIDNTGNLKGSGNDILIGANRHFYLRSYTTGTLPSATPAGQLIYVSDASTGQKVQVSNGSAWEAPTGGGGGSAWDFNPPLAANFTPVSGDATLVTLSDDPDVGMCLSGGTSIGGNIMRIATMPLASSGAADFTATAKLCFNHGDLNAGIGLFMRESATNKILFYGSIRGSTRYSFTGTMTSFLSSLINYAYYAVPVWVRVRYVHSATRYYLDSSTDGKNWVEETTFLATTPFTTRANQIGFGFQQAAASATKVMKLSVPYWTLV